MAEIFASASAAVGVAAAGGQLFDGIAKLSAICLEVRDIPADIRSAVDDLSALSEVLDSTQLEIDQDTLLRTLDPTVSKKVLAGLQQNSQSVSNMLHVMETNVKEKKLWGRIKAVGKKKKLGKSLSRSQSDQILLLLALATDNRALLRHGLNNLQQDFAEVSGILSAATSNLQATGQAAENRLSCESPSTTEELKETQDIATARQLKRKSKKIPPKSRTLRLKFPEWFFSQVWEVKFCQATQGWDFAVRSYRIRPMESEIFHAIENRDLAQVRRLLSSGEASLRDRDPGGSTVLHHAAQYCFLSEDSLAIFEFLVTNGADINATDFCGWPAHSFLSRYRIFTDHVGDIPIQQRFTKAYRICMRHPEWVMTRPSAEWNPVSKVDTICLANLSSAEAMSLALNEMWPPWEERTFSDRVDIIFPPHRDISPFAFPSSIRLCLGHNSFQDLFSECDVLRQRRLARYAFDALAVRLAERSTVMVEDARQLLKDMTSTTALLPLLAFESSPLHNFAKGYVWWYSNCSFSFGSSSTRWPLRDDECIIKEALTTYITEMMSLGMDIISLVEVENRYWQNQRLTLRESRSHNIKICRNEERSFLRCTYRSYCIIRLDCGPDIDKWRLWLSNPLDEWAGEFWDMIDHPERAIPGAWNDE